jgi:hypothetical protein
MRATEDTPPLRAVGLLIAGAARRLSGVATALSRESANRESHSPKTHGVPVRHVGTSRSVTRIIRRGALHASRQKTWRPEGRHVGSEPSSCEGSPLTMAPIVVSARTSLAVTTRADSSTAWGQRRHATSCGRAQGSRHTSGAKVSRGTHRLLAAISGCGSDEGRRPCDALQVPRPLRCDARSSRLTRRSSS